MKRGCMTCSSDAPNANQLAGRSMTPSARSVARDPLPALRSQSSRAPTRMNLPPASPTETACGPSSTFVPASANPPSDSAPRSTVVDGSRSLHDSSSSRGYRHPPAAGLTKNPEAPSVAATLSLP